MGKHSLGEQSVQTLAFLGNHLPRHCGIATFTTNLVDAIAAESPSLDAFVVAMNDAGARHAYPPRVRLEVSQGDLEGYRLAADFLNVNSVDVLSVQHEYGIFGGAGGAHVLELMREVRRPIVTTLHTILEKPDAAQRTVMDEVLRLSERVVVMSADGAALLKSVHGLEPSKIDVIPHGIPEATRRPNKEALGVEDRPVILTFGLLSPDKGLEYVIDAMPAILKAHPGAVYMVVGATHPHVKQHDGETYRHSLQVRAERLGVSSSVIFHNRFVSHDELVEFLGATDVYITPYLKEEQSTSGTLAYAIGCGKAVVSTPYRYARELLADDRGVLVPWRDAGAIGKEVVSLLSDPDKRARLQQRAAAYGKSMSWPTVAQSYLTCFSKARSTYIERRATDLNSRIVAQRRPELPALNLSHLRQLTDDTGILQHATFDIPSYSDGYCLDDNARALLLLTLIEESGSEPPSLVRALASRYLAFVNHAFDSTSGKFRNFLSYSRTWTEESGSDDSHGRALWALGTVSARSHDRSRRSLSAQIFVQALPATESHTSPRAWAYTLLGLDEFLNAYPHHESAVALRARLCARLLERFAHTQSVDWPWFEDRLTYCNARIPQALLVTGNRLGDASMTDLGLSSLDWLVFQQTSSDGTFTPVGTNGFFERGKARAAFDQQPVEACGTVFACLDAYRISGQAKWLERARTAFRWFLGQNVRDAQVYDARTGGCRDGIHADRLNENQGAESTLSFLMALVEMRVSDGTSRVGPPISAPRLQTPHVTRPQAQLTMKEGSP